MSCTILFAENGYRLSVTSGTEVLIEWVVRRCSDVSQRCVHHAGCCWCWRCCAWSFCGSCSGCRMLVCVLYGVAKKKRMRMPGFEPGISQPQCEVLTTILHAPGEAGYRSQYLSHAKRALYHVSYIPIQHPTPSNRIINPTQKPTSNKRDKTHKTHHTTS